MVGCMQLQLYEIRPDCFPKCSRQLLLPPAMQELSCCPIVPNNTWHCDFLDAYPLNGYRVVSRFTWHRWELCCPAMTRHVLSCVWPFGSPHPPIDCSYFFPFTKSGRFVFFLLSCRVLYTAWKQVFCWLYVLQVYSSGLSLACLFPPWCL